jgi:hypothetical protein
MYTAPNLELLAHDYAIVLGCVPKCYRSRGADEGYVDERTVCGSVSVSTSAVRCVVVGEWTY